MRLLAGARVPVRRIGQFQPPGAGLFQIPPSPPGPPPHPPSREAEVVVSALSPEDLSGLPGVRVSLREVRGGVQGAVLASGTTGRDGRAVLRGRVAPDAIVRVLVGDTASLGAPTGRAGASRDVDVSLGQAAEAFVACPEGTDPVCAAVAEKQLLFSQVYQHQLAAWNYESSGRPPQIAAFAADVAHTAISGAPNVPSEPDLARYWPYELSWIATDLGIPPGDWPDLVRWYAQTRRIFDSIPFPSIEEAEDLFRRCARGIPLTVGRNGENMPLANGRLYSRTYSDYFPRSDAQVERDMAARYLMNMPAIFLCMDHKLRHRAREVERSARTMSFLSLAATFMLAPMAGGAGMLSSIATEISSFATSSYGAGSVQAEGITAAVAAGLIGAGDAKLVVSALAPLVEQQIAGLDPAAQQAVRTALPRVVDAAVDAVSSNTLAQGAADFGALASVQSALATAAVKALASIPKLYAANRVEEFRDAAAGVQQAAVDFLRMAQGDGVPESFRPFMQWAYEKILGGVLDEVLQDFYDHVAQAYGVDASGLPLPSSGVAPGQETPPPPAGVPGDLPPPGADAPPPGTGWPEEPGAETEVPRGFSAGGVGGGAGLAVAGAGALALLFLTGVIR